MTEHDHTEYDYVEYDEENDASIITFDRPGKLNAFNTGLLRELQAAIEWMNAAEKD